MYGAFYGSTYGASVSLEEQMRVLEGLGLPVSADVRDRMEQLMREYPDYKSYLESCPYPILLSDMGYPEYDDDTWEVVAYSKDVYWLDMEMFGLEEGYAELLEAIEAMSAGEVRMELESFKTDIVDWEEGTGTLTMAFRCNEHPYTVDVRVMSDWMDVGILAKLNEVLAQENCTSRLYFCGDAGQGLLLFYRDAEWAEDFERLTGLELESGRERSEVEK